MNKRFLPSRLSIYILLCFLLASALSVGFFFGLKHISDGMISRHFSKISFAQQQTKRELDSFQAFVNDNNISTKDVGKIHSWITSEKYVLMNIYKDDYLVYCSSAPGFISSYQYKKEDISPSWRRLYNVDFADGTANVDIVLLASSKYYDAATAVELIMAFICFIIVFLSLISKKFRYINLLSKELKILEGGDLKYAVTVKGKDEIMVLAQGINEMRKSVLERIESENEAHKANRELITSISHDLRTPLTILIGNLDIIAEKKYKTEEQFTRYVELCRSKAYQLKELSDKLFEYFLVYDGGDMTPDMEYFSSNSLLSQLIGEYVLSLKDIGCETRFENAIPECGMEVNLIAVRRVFDNLFSNIRKYADLSKPVTISYAENCGTLSITIENAVPAVRSGAESTNIGLKTCEKIMSQHNGSISFRQSQDTFTVTVTFQTVTVKTEQIESPAQQESKRL